MWGNGYFVVAVLSYFLSLHESPSQTQSYETECEYEHVNTSFASPPEGYQDGEDRYEPVGEQPGATFLPTHINTHLTSHTYITTHPKPLSVASPQPKQLHVAKPSATEGTGRRAVSE